MKFNVIPINKLPKKKKQRKKSKHESSIFGLRKCKKCLQIKTLPNYDRDSFFCERCSITNITRGYADYVEEARIYDDWKSKFPNIQPCHRCRGLYPPYVTSLENGKVTCANCFLIIEEENKANGK